MPSEARQKKIMEKLNRAQKCSILGPQNLGSGGGPGPPGPPLDPHLNKQVHLELYEIKICQGKWYICPCIVFHTRKKRNTL